MDVSERLWRRRRLLNGNERNASESWRVENSGGCIHSVHSAHTWQHVKVNFGDFPAGPFCEHWIWMSEWQHWSSRFGSDALWHYAIAWAQITECRNEMPQIVWIVSWHTFGHAQPGRLAHNGRALHCTQKMNSTRCERIWHFLHKFIGKTNIPLCWE